ncbi:hypothetical protein [Acinetobacter guerrae]|uniref:hypothetical protein n=1 Tax=Acinetobacter guerrae TaxID=1843371 RepID=UPI00125FAD01|nr:hypothetical protein [Acinetobacter guerrae]
MAIRKRPCKTYQLWPYRPELENGKTNIGGIDLVKEPHRIDEIHELDLMPKLKNEILLLNSEPTKFMTLGCWFDTAPDIEDVFRSYIEFCFRPSFDTSSFSLATLDEQFYEFIQNRAGAEARHTIENRLDWVYHHTLLYNVEPNVMVFHVTVEGYTSEDIESFLIPLVVWLRKYYPNTSP